MSGVVEDFGRYILKDAILHAAARVRKTARNSLKTKPGSSPAGQPPFSHVGHIKNRLLYAWDESTLKSAVIGPEFDQSRSKHSEVPGLLEHGGTTTIRVDRSKTRRLGGSGEIRLGGAIGPTSRVVKTNAGKVRTVTYAKLKTEDQVARANRINMEIFGPVSREVSIAARPYMQPALEKNRDRLDSAFTAA